MRNYVKSEYHGHEIIVSAVEERCFFCRYPASHKVEEDTSNYETLTHPPTAYVCCDHFWYSCRNDNAPKCSKCKHPWHTHEKEIKLADRTVIECDAYMGMGDWCGCEEKKPDDISE